MNSPVTLKQLAELLKLAPSTVSRALKGHPDINPVTQEKVRAMAQQLHYRPNALASSLRKRKSHVIALIVPDIKNYYYSCVISSVVYFAYVRGYKVCLFESREEYNREVDICRFLQKSGVDGLIITPAKNTVESEHLQKLQKEGIVLFLLDRILGDIDADRALSDDYHGAYLIVNQMIDAGFQKIAHLTLSQKLLWAQKREMGYIQALLDHHIEIDRSVIIEYTDLTEIEQITRHLIEHSRVDGIFAINDECAVKVLMSVHRAGKMVPGDIAVCGFGNDPMSEVTCPPLTTLDRNCDKIGKLAVDFLIDRIEGKSKGETVTKLLKGRLIVRESTMK